MTNPDLGGVGTLARFDMIPLAPGAAESTSGEPSDEVLMFACARRDEGAFSLLYDRYAGPVYSTCLRVLADPQLAQDAAQEVFAGLWRRAEAFVASRGRFRSWLLSVARNRALDALRARGRRRLREGGGAEEVLAFVPDEGAIDPQHSAQLREQQERVRGALTELPPGQRAALELAYFGGLTHQEIALALHAPLGTIKTRIRLAMQKLRQLLAEMEAD